MGTIAVTPAQLDGAASMLRRAGSELKGCSPRGLGAGDLGSPEVESALTELSAATLAVVDALAGAVALAGLNLGAGAGLYSSVDATAMRPGGR
jgi:hypothetical protein